MRVLVTGSFDILHPGHIFLLEQAAQRGEVYVIVARDSTIKYYKRKLPTIPENQRLAVVQAIKYVSFATLGNRTDTNQNFIEKALDLKPDLILLGPNQRISIEELQLTLKAHNASHIAIERLPQLDKTYPLHSSSLIRKKIIEDAQNERSNTH